MFKREDEKIMPFGVLMPNDPYIRLRRPPRGLFVRAEDPNKCIKDKDCPPPQCPSCPQDQKCVLVTRSCNLCASAKCVPLAQIADVSTGPQGGNNTNWTLIGGVIGAIGFVVLLVGVLLYFWRKKTRGTNVVNSKNLNDNGRPLEEIRAGPLSQNYDIPTNDEIGPRATIIKTANRVNLGERRTSDKGGDPLLVTRARPKLVRVVSKRKPKTEPGVELVDSKDYASGMSSTIEPAILMNGVPTNEGNDIPQSLNAENENSTTKDEYSPITIAFDGDDSKALIQTTSANANQSNMDKKT
ncbi:uncharacterized protein VTP21DRAFT_8562 [Calcarisporiella thermophila]|uniref:uncharacterized protein n=1 Tax=Calcarisporiella thermophila TaxID=911321 RepID=UPI0037424F01